MYIIINTHKKMGHKILKMKDKFGSLKKKKKDIFDMPFRALIVGKSELSGKSNLVGNLLLREEFYKNDFEGDDIFLICPSTNLDEKFKVMIEEKEIPECNVFYEFDEEILELIYNNLIEEFNEMVREGIKPSQKLLILDDVAVNLKDKQKGVLNKIMMNGRHILLNVLMTSQKYSLFDTVQRENATGLMVFSCSDKQLQLIGEDHNIMKNKKQFRTTFRKTTEEPFSFMVINYSNPKKDRYMDTEFNPINLVEDSSK